MQDKYGVSGDPYCWPGTTVLRNALGIRDEALLADAEAEFAALALERILIEEPPFDLAYLCRLHRQLFGEIPAPATRPESIARSANTCGSRYPH